MEKPRILRVDADQPDRTAIAAAAAALTRGGLVVLPTETVYGLAADPRATGALEGLYAAKGRTREKPITLFAPDIPSVVAHGAELGRAGRLLAERFWPGPLTLVLAGRGGTLGFRVPAHHVPLALLRELGAVLAVTSANRSGELDARTAHEAAAALGAAATLVLDAGPAGDRPPSTVVRADGERVEILRRGAIAEDEIRAVLAAGGVGMR